MTTPFRRAPQSSGRQDAAALAGRARAAWQNADYDQALKLLGKAARLEPRNADLWLALGKAHGFRYDYDAAAKWFQKAFDLAPQASSVFFKAGAYYHQMGRLKPASECLEKAVRLAPGQANTHLLLGEICERLHRLEDAREAVERALHLEPSNPGVRLLQARLARRQGGLSAAESILRSVAEGPMIHWEVQARSWYELAQVLDAAGRFAEVMPALEKGKALQRPHAAPGARILEGVRARATEMLAMASPELFGAWRQALPDLAPARQLALLCGHPRSGTTLIEQVLDSHPAVVTTEETRVLHDEAYLPLSRGFRQEASVIEVLNAATPARLREVRRDYFRCTESILGSAVGGRILIDKNPAFNILLLPLARIFPEAKLLMAIRDPRDVCLSCFMQPLSLNPVSSSYLTLGGTVEQYASVMGFLLGLRPRLKNDWIEVRYEDFVTDLRTGSKRLLQFLGVPWDEGVLQFHEHARSKPVLSPTYAEVIHPVHRRAVGRWQNYAPHLEPHLKVLRPFLEAFGYSP